MSHGANPEPEPAAAAAGARPLPLVMRGYFSTYHLYAARYAADDAQTAESNRSAGPASFNIRHRGYVFAAVVESAAFLEAAINELYQDAADGHLSYIGTLDPDCVRLLAELWRTTAQGRVGTTFEKYDMALAFAGQGGFDRGAAPYQDAALLVRLRNYLLHYKPEGVSADTPHKLGAALDGKFAGSTFMSGSGNPWFPDHALGAGCASWAWRSARAFVDEFTARMGIAFNYTKADFDDPLPP